MYTFGWITEETALPWEPDVTDYIFNQFVNIVQTGTVLIFSIFFVKFSLLKPEIIPK